MKKEFLRQKLQGNPNPKWEQEIDQAVDLGKSLSISPRYTFYYSPETGCRYILNKELIRVYPEVRIRRYWESFLIFECTGNHRIKISGHADLLQIRAAYDAVCPQVLTGRKDHEMGMGDIKLVQQKRKQVFKVLALTQPFAALLCWAASWVSLQWNTWLGAGVLAATLLLDIGLLIRLTRSLTRLKK